MGSQAASARRKFDPLLSSELGPIYLKRSKPTTCNCTTIEEEFNYEYGKPICFKCGKVVRMRLN